MRVLTVPNWSFGRDRDLLHKFDEVLKNAELTVHYLRSDVDHNRTVSAFSGDAEKVFSSLATLASLAFERIDLNRHVGVHPRIGALDVCPFLPLGDPGTIFAEVESFAAQLAASHNLPVFLYEKSERGRHEADLPSIRKGGFGGLLGRELRPDFGPARAHPHLGVTVMGVREFLIAMNVNLAGEDATVAKAIAREIRSLRSSGDARFLGVRALGFSLSSVGLSQVSLNLTLPDLTPVDPIVTWIMEEAAARGARFANTELIGVIRAKDVGDAGRLVIDPAQIVEAA